MIVVSGALQPLDVLCIAPHPDDAEIGAGGSLILWARQYQTGILELSRGEMGTQGTPETRLRETRAASEIMGLHFRGNLALNDGELKPTPENTLKLAQALRVLRPKLLLIPHHHDRHPDHYGSYALCKEAVHVAGLAKTAIQGAVHKVPRILLYQGNFPITADVLIDTSAVQDQWKNAVLAHHSQFGGANISETVTPEIVERRQARNMYWGTFAGVRYAEAFVSEVPLKVSVGALL